MYQFLVDLCRNTFSSYRTLKVTGEPLIQRKDDTPAVLKSRLEAFHRQTEPVCLFPPWNITKFTQLFVAVMTIWTNSDCLTICRWSIITVAKVFLPIFLRRNLQKRSLLRFTRFFPHRTWSYLFHLFFPPIFVNHLELNRYIVGKPSQKWVFTGFGSPQEGFFPYKIIVYYRFCSDIEVIKFLSSVPIFVVSISFSYSFKPKPSFWYLIHPS